MTDPTQTTAHSRVLEDAEEVRLLEQRLSIARQQLELSERNLDRLTNPRQQGAIDVIDGVLHQTAVAIDVWRALRRNGLLKDESDAE